MTTRRSFLAGSGSVAGLAAVAAPAPGWAEAGSPLWLGAAREVGGGHALFGIGADLARTFRVPLPGRGHAAAAHPARAEAVAFARRPGTFALVIDCASGIVRRRLEAPVGRHFYGHGAFLDGGAILATTENDYATGEGRIGLWDAGAGYARLGEIASGGIGPHEALRLPGTDVLVVANGGIRTHPETGRETLNLAVMRPNLTYLAADGRVLDRVELEPAMRLASIRHLAARADGTVAFALQWQGEEASPVPLLGLHRRGGPVRLLAADDEAQRRLAGYAGSVAWSGAGDAVAITSPRGGVAHVFPAAGGAPEIVERADVCGAATAPGGLVLSDGAGGLTSGRAARRHPCAWDNHLVALTSTA